MSRVVWRSAARTASRSAASPAGELSPRVVNAAPLSPCPRPPPAWRTPALTARKPHRGLEHRAGRARTDTPRSPVPFRVGATVPSKLPKGVHLRGGGGDAGHTVRTSRKPTALAASESAARPQASMGLSADLRPDTSTPRLTDARSVLDMGLSARTRPPACLRPSGCARQGAARARASRAPARAACILGPPAIRRAPSPRASLNRTRPNLGVGATARTRSVHPQPAVARTRSVHAPPCAALGTVLTIGPAPLFPPLPGSRMSHDTITR
jgi:hypothetical protein